MAKDRMTRAAELAEEARDRAEEAYEARGQECIERAVLGGEVRASHALQIGGRDALHGVKITLGEIQVDRKSVV